MNKEQMIYRIKRNYPSSNRSNRIALGSLNKVGEKAFINIKTIERGFYYSLPLSVSLSI